MKDIQIYMSFETKSHYEDLLEQLVKFIYFGGLYDVTI
jgi:hypothetical protein